MRRIVIIFILAIMPVISLAETLPTTDTSANVSDTHEITISARDAIVLAGDLVERGDYENATTILTQTPALGGELEIERWFLLAQIASRTGDIDTAIKIYRTILDAQPNLARVRFELAVCYMHQQKWRRADYHLRLAMAGDDLPENVRQMMNYYRWIVRQNKNWNIWFNFGAAPDNNVNNSIGGEECVMTMFGLMCHELADPESAIGANFILGGDYEFKLSDHWRWKSDANIYTNIYNLHDYDDLYLSASTGPRYVWSRGDVWFAPILTRRWYGWERYNWSYGLRLDTNYDFTRKLSGGLYLRLMNNAYDMYGDFLNGQTYSVSSRIFYSFNASIYMMARGGLTREDTVNKTYSYWQPNISIGIGAELPWGFHIYAEPSIYWTLYDDARWTVKDNTFTEITEQDFTHRYAVSVSNNKLDIWGFVPTLTFSYTKRESNIWQREFDKVAIEFTMQQRF